MKTNRILIETMALISILPILKANIHSAVLLFLFILWIYNSAKLTGFRYIFSDPWGIARWWGILISYEIILSLAGFSSTMPTVFMTRIPIYFISVMMAFVLRMYSDKEQKHIFVFIASIILFTIVQNTIIYIPNPSFFDGFSYTKSEFRWTNWGTTSFINCALFLVPSCFFIYQIKNLTKNIRLLAFWGLILPFFYIVIINERATSFIVLLFLIASFLYIKNVRINNRTVYTIVTMCIIVIIVLSIVPIINLFSSVLHSEELIVRLDSISSSIQNSELDESSESSLFGRFLLAQLSFNTWTKSFSTFLFGIGEDALAADSLQSFADLFDLGIGQHSMIIDFLAMYGILGSMILYKALHATFSCIRSFSNSHIMNRELNAVFISYILMNILNNTFLADDLFVMFLLFGVSVRIYSNNKSLNNFKVGQLNGLPKNDY